MTLKPTIVQVVIDKPLAQGFDYLWDAEKLGKLPEIGNVVSVPFARSKVIALVIKVSNHSDYEISKLKSVESLAPLPVFDPALLRLMNFASQYYVHALGETILPVIPQMWKKADDWEKILEKLKAAEKQSKKKLADVTEGLITLDQLNSEQKIALDQLLSDGEKENQFRAILLQGQTGSGKTAVFLNWLASTLKEEDAQVLLLVPEINLTPQLERQVSAYFPDKKMAVLHSGISEKKRGVAWYEAMTGKAQIILGTRLAALTPIPNLRVIVVDEEHDPSYKQQDGTRYSARDLAIWRAHDQKIPILLSSATPSLETWLAAKSGRYENIRLDQRAQGASLPCVHLINTRDPQNQFSPGDVGASKQKSLITKTLANAITKTLAEKKQSLILINRRGYAPVLSCTACNWLSKCTQCSTYTVMHKAGALSKRSVLNCHHCGLVKSIPQFCPDCGNADLKTLGHGTQKLEDAIEEMWPQARVLRVDTDSSRKSKGAEALFKEIHDGNVDIVVGTQMIAKGHDYQNIGLVAVLDADSRLYSADFRAAERLFAQLVQVAGRAGRSGTQGEAGGDIYIETQYPESPVFQYLLRHDVDGFLAFTAKEREEAKLPPYSYQALIHAEGKSLDQAIQFLNELKTRIKTKGLITKELKVYDPVPKPVMRVAGAERAQLLIESGNRKLLQETLEIIDQELRQDSTGRISKTSRIRWLVERDPIAI
ncbi:primosomal protein N' [Polynucleobacter duraquae]|jgi:primosomal protein N' (replication factor Y)|uniref:Replication restart protein PriA n=1 Tax=Polynucleobacter duraquae TaxID=1835254 RepID=A0A0E3V072_9BURK|nr:primosomal protein N' [Polynucleobacter duraquae]AKD24358.1 primosomal protein N' [Polynucleobacter duraquae]